MLPNCVHIVFGLDCSLEHCVRRAVPLWFGFKKFARTCASELRAHCTWPLDCSLEHCVRRAVPLWFGFKKFARTCASELRAHCVWPLDCSLEHCVRRAVPLWFGFKKFARTCSSEARAHCVLCFKMLTWTMKNCILPQRAQEILHHMNVRVICNIAACTLRFGFDGLTFRGWVDFSLTARAHAVGWLHATWVDLTPPPSTIESDETSQRECQQGMSQQASRNSRILGCSAVKAFARIQILYISHKTVNGSTQKPHRRAWGQDSKETLSTPDEGLWCKLGTSKARCRAHTNPWTIKLFLSKAPFSYAQADLVWFTMPMSCL